MNSGTILTTTIVMRKHIPPNREQFCVPICKSENISNFCCDNDRSTTLQCQNLIHLAKYEKRLRSISPISATMILEGLFTNAVSIAQFMVSINVLVLYFCSQLTSRFSAAIFLLVLYVYKKNVYKLKPCTISQPLKKLPKYC